jgi:tRNA G46 methylase TrmB
MTYFGLIARDLVTHESFHAYVEGVKESWPYCVDWYPVQRRILDCSGNPDDPLIVDIGAGSGRDMLAFKRKFPTTTGRYII